MKLFSVILTHYNQNKYIYEAIDSVLIQDYANIQLIITDDNSDSFSKKDITDYINKKKISNIVDLDFVINTRNNGTVKTINKAIKNAKGEYILIFAADDALYDAKTLSNYVEQFETYKRCDIITTQAYMVGDKLIVDNDSTLFVAPEKMQKFNRLNPRRQFYYIAEECPFVSGATAYRRRLFDSIGYFDEDFVLVEDWSFWLKVTLNKKAIRYVDNISLLHRNGGVSHSEFKKIPPKVEKYYRDIIKVYTKYIIPKLKKASKKYKRLIVDKYMFYIGYYDQFIPNIYNDNLEYTKLAWKYTDYEKYFKKMQKMREKGERK